MKFSRPQVFLQGHLSPAAQNSAIWQQWSTQLTGGLTLPPWEISGRLGIGKV